MRVAVTGATGIVGRFVCARLLAQGHTVQALCRPTSITAGFTQQPHWVVGELDEESALQQLLEGMEAVVHCAFSHVTGRYRGGEGDDVQGFWRTNLGGTLHLLETSQHAGVQRVVLLSSRAVFGRRRPGEDPHSAVDDDHPLWPGTHYGALKAAEEALATAYPAMAVCALRPTGVYGLTFPLERSKWFELASDVIAGTSTTASRSATEVHGRDVAAAVTCLLEAAADQVRGRGFNCSDITLSTRELVREIATRAGLQAELPPASPAVVNPMRCDALRNLGWQPGGMERLSRTLDELVQCVLASRQ